ncbi:(2Fe-2S)-binding protein [Rhizobium sullae]|uniref:(2Fe-2S)-binding protein n=1 Tax=Rhizobium sullae TaxID=50338 RepID=UPI0009FC7A4E
MQGRNLRRIDSPELLSSARNHNRFCTKSSLESVEERQITTIEALDTVAHGKALQDAWIELEVPQCGYCQSGQLMSAAALLNETPKPTDDDIDNAMSGNVCRCGTYQRIRAAIKRASA